MRGAVNTKVTELSITKGFAKVEIGLAKGKKLHDKRDDIAKKDQKREMDRASKGKYNY